MNEEPMVCFCGLPMSRNPHPDAGLPTMEGVVKVGAVWECIPCAIRTRNSANNRWSLAQLEIDRLRRVIMDSLCSCSRSRAEDEPHHPLCRALRILKQQKGTNDGAVL